MKIIISVDFSLLCFHSLKHSLTLLERKQYLTSVSFNVFSIHWKHTEPFHENRPPRKSERERERERARSEKMNSKEYKHFLNFSYLKPKYHRRERFVVYTISHSL